MDINQTLPTILEFRDKAAITRSCMRGGNISGHLETAWYEIPMAFEAADIDPPSNLIASCLFINVIEPQFNSFCNQSSRKNY